MSNDDKEYFGCSLLIQKCFVFISKSNKLSITRDTLLNEGSKTSASAVVTLFKIKKCIEPYPK